MDAITEIQTGTRQRLADHRHVADLVAQATTAVPPMWPLESAIAVNPLAGFEQLPFAAAVEEAAALFGANQTLPLAQWRALLDRGAVDDGALRDVAIARLGGLDAAFELVGVDVSRFDLLVARLKGGLTGTPSAALREAVEARFAAFAMPAERPHLIAPTERIGVEMLGYARAFVAKWCGAFFDQSVAAWPMPHRERGLYAAVLALVAKDPDFIRFGGAEAQAIIDSAEAEPLAAIEQSLIALGLEGDNRIALLRTLIARLPGWAGHIRWRTEQADPDIVARAPATMADYLALWLLVERACALRDWPEAPVPPAVDPTMDRIAALAAHFRLEPEAVSGLPLPGAKQIHDIAALGDGELGLIWLEAAERGFRGRLVPAIEAAASVLPSDVAERPAAQLVFCIDVRSEPFRRAVEAAGDYETFGYAGFFGLPIAIRPPCGHRRKMLPVLLSPGYDLKLAPAGTAGQASLDGKQRRQATNELLATLKSGAATTFSTAEAMGPFAALISVARTLMPKLVRKACRNDGGAFAPVLDPDGEASGLPVQARIDAARGFFAYTGMPRRTARLVLLAGHGGEAVNNPYKAALDCGACGGHAGGPNARAMAAVLNDPAVRAALAGDGDAIPEDTLFLAGEHNTTTDEVTIFDLEAVPASHRAEVALFAHDLARAGATNRARRASALGSSPDGLFDAAAHWGEVRPEWGLARNAAFIVAPRALTKGVDLDGRAFLHSYDWRTDADDAALTLILTAPMVVAQWINCQYLFSTLDNDRYGAGDKTTHNVMGGIGVVQGNGGDLRVGLPKQSLFADDGTPYHVPQRLLTIVHAPVDKVERVIAANEILQRLFGNGWVNLVVVDPQTGKAMRRRPDGELEAAAGGPVPAPVPA